MMRHLPGSPRTLESFVFTDATARIAYTPRIDDIGRYAYQQNDGTLWRCTSWSPPQWINHIVSDVATLVNQPSGVAGLTPTSDFVTPHWIGVGTAPTYPVDVAGSGYGLRVKAAAQSDSAQLRIETAGLAGGAGGAAGLDFYDGPSTRSGRLTAALSNAPGGRYFGFICEVDRDATNLPFIIFTRSASGSNTRALTVWPDPQQGAVTIGNLGTAPNAILHVYNAEVGVTTGILEMLRLQHNSSGVAAAGFGTAAMFAGKSSSNANREMADITVQWATATDASRKARLSLSAWDTAAREGIRIEADGSAPLVGLYGVAAVARQTVAAAASDAATTMALVNDLRAKLIAIGIVQ